jgi:acyl-CoA dehydrogenase
MISFSLTEEQQMLVDAVNRYAEREMRQTFRESDEQGQLAQGLVERGWELGLTPSNIPETFGGFGQHAGLNGVLYAEELGWGDLATAMALMSPNLVAIPVLEFGTEQQQQNILPHFCGTEFVPATAALIEPNIRYDPGNLQTRATLKNGGYVLDGRKAYVPLAAEARLILVYATQEGQTQGFVVEAGAEGLAIGQREQNMGLKALPTYELTLDGVRVGAECKLGGSNGIEFGRLQNYSRVALAALAVGVARGSYEYALEYAKNREAFGESIASRQAIAFLLAEMAIDIDAARLMTWEAAWKLDQGQDATAEAYLAKQFADEMVLRVTDAGVQILGGHGYIRDYPVELWLRNGRGFATFDGMAMV